MACSRMGMVVSIHIQRSGCDSCDSQLFSVYRMVRTRLGLHVSVLMSSINNEPSRVHDARNVSMAMFPCDDGSDVRNTVTQSTKRGLPFFPTRKTSATHCKARLYNALYKIFQTHQNKAQRGVHLLQLRIDVHVRWTSVKY